MRTLNLRLTIILCVVVLFSGVGIYLLHNYQVRRNAHVFKEQAELAAAEAEEATNAKDLRRLRNAYKRALDNYGWYARLMPDDIDSLEKLAKLMAKTADTPQKFGRAYGMLENVLRADPTRTGIRRELVDMAIGIKRYPDAMQHLQEFLLKESPDNPELWELQARCYLGSAEYDKCLESIRKAIELNPQQVQAYPFLAGVLQQHFMREKEADAVIEDMLKANPESAKAHYFAAANFNAKKQDDKALAEIEKALSLFDTDQQLKDTDRKGILLLAARCYLAPKNFDKARECAQRGLELDPGMVEMYNTLRDIEILSDNREKALAIIQQGLKETDRNPFLLWQLANLNIDDEEFQEARKIIEELKTANFTKAYIDYLTSRIDYSQGNWLAARRGLEKTRSAFMAMPGGGGQLINMVKQIDMWIAYCYLRLGNRDQQIEALRHALKIDPFFAPARAALTQATLATGDVEGAMGEFSHLAKTGNVGKGGLMSYGKMQIIQNMRLPKEERDWRPFEGILAQAEKSNPNAIEVPLLRAERLVAEDQLEDAEKVLVQSQEKNPDRQELQAALAVLAERRGDWTKTEALLAKIKESKGDTVDYRLALAQYLVRKKGKDAINELHALLDNEDQFADDNRLKLWNGLLNMALQTDDRDQIKLLANRITEKSPNDVQPHYILFEQSLRNAPPDEAGMDEALKNIEKVAGQDAFWQYGQAVRITLKVKEKDDPDNLLDKALEYLVRARNLRQSWSQPLILMANIYDQQGKSDLALKTFLEAIDMGDFNPNAVRRAVQLLSQSQQYDKAEQLLKRLEKSQTTLTPEMTKANAEIALRQGDYSRALELAQKTSLSDTSDVQECLWIGQVVGLLGHQAQKAGKNEEAAVALDKAEKALRRAVELDPKNPIAWISLVRFLGESKEKEKAQQAIEEATKNLPPKSAPMTIAQCYDVLGEKDTAEEKYEAALAESPQDPAIVRSIADFYCRTNKPAPAKLKLQLIVDDKVASPKADVMWARRQLAKFYASEPDYQSQQTARALIQKNLAEPETTPEDRRILVGLDMSDPKQKRREEAIRSLEKLQADQKATPEDLLTLAQRYNEKNEWVKAAATYRQAISLTNNNEPRYLAGYIAALLEHGDVSDSDLYLRQLEKIAPNHIATASLRAAFLVAKKDPDGAAALLDKFLSTEKTTPSDPDDKMAVLAEQYEIQSNQLKKTGQTDAAKKFVDRAESLFADFVAKKPGKLWFLYGFYTRQQRPNEALDILEKNFESVNPPTLIQLISMLLQCDLSDTQLQRIENIAKSALKQHNQPASLLMVLGDIYAKQHRLAESEQIYRDILEKDSNSFYALNNLAVLLALRGEKLDDALQMVNKALEIAGPKPAIIDSRATVYMALKQPDKAIADMSEVLNDGESPVRLFHMAQALLLANQENEAVETMKKALEKGLTQPMLHPLEIPAFEKLEQLAK